MGFLPRPRCVLLHFPEEFAEKVEKSFAEYKENFLKKLNGETDETDTTEDKA